MTTISPPRATRREWIGLAIIALPCVVYAMDVTVLNLAVPALSAALDPTASQLLWIIDIYGFLVAGFLITMGTLGDRIGRRKLLMIGAAAFGAASALAAYSNSAEMLIAMRALLGVAGATLAPSTMSLIRNMFHDESQRQFAIGVWIASFSLGGAIGPLVGGALIEWYWWGSVFLVAVPVMGSLLVLGPVLLPEYRDPNAGSVDIPSVALSLAAVLLTTYGLKHAAEHGPSVLAAAFFVAGVLLGTAFVRRQSNLAYPLLDLTLFRRPRFGAAIAAYALSCLAMFGVYIFITQYLQLVLGLSPLRAGIATLPWGVAFIVGSLLAPKLARHVSPISLLVCGLAVAAAGFVLIAVAGDEWLPGLIAALIVMSLGLSPVFTVGNEMIITSAPPERAGAASALSETGAELSGAIGVAVLGSLGMLLYRTRLERSAPAGLEPDALFEAKSTLGAALDASASLPAQLGDALAETARAAFVDAMQFAAVAGAAILFVAGAAAARILGRPAEAAASARPESSAS
jgi:DHA2 family multidrug resistance protein-like MFS transporter